MILLVISWILLLIVFLSFGDMFTSLWNRITKESISYSIIDKVWIGICSVGIILLYLSIFIPLNMWVLGAFCCIAVFYILFWRSKFVGFFQVVKDFLKQQTFLTGVLLVLAIIAIIIFSLAVPTLYDVGLYHLQSMQWAADYKTIVGLGNLHGRLGFNSSFLLLSTLFDYRESGAVFFTINSFCLLIFTAWIFGLLTKVENGGQKIVLLFTLLFVLFFTGKSISSSSTDLLPNLLVIYLLVSWVIYPESFSKKSLLYGLLAIFCITLKLSSALIVVLAFFLIIYLFVKGNKRTSISLILLGILVAVPWLARFIIFTGYMIYPFPSLDLFSFDWKIPMDMVVEEQNAAYAWAKIPDMPIDEVMNYSLMQWVPIWFKNLSYMSRGAYSLALVSPLVMLFTRKKMLGIAWAIAFVGSLFGFLTAPDFRFTFGFVIAAGIIPLLLIAEKVRFKETLFRGVSYFSILPLVLLIYIAAGHLMFFHNYSENTAFMLILEPQDGRMLKEYIDFESYDVGGVTISVPNGTNQCFDQPVPCMPYPNNRLEMRGDKIEYGFRIKTQ